jgi:hypothetical protein
VVVTLTANSVVRRRAQGLGCRYGASCTPGTAAVQVSEAVPLTPPPPIDSGYLVAAPAATVVELETPDAIRRPRLGAAPTVCGLFGALSVITRFPVRVPDAVGAKLTCTVHWRQPGTKPALHPNHHPYP